MQNYFYDWKYFAINFNNINNGLIDKNNLLKLYLYNFTLNYLKDGLFYITEIKKNKNEEKQDKKLKVSDSKDKKKK